MYGRVRISDPRGAELRPARHNKQHPGVVDPADNQFKQLKCGWIWPVRILEDADRRAFDGKRQERVDERTYRPVLYLLWRKVRKLEVSFQRESITVWQSAGPPLWNYESSAEGKP